MAKAAPQYGQKAIPFSIDREQRGQSRLATGAFEEGAVFGPANLFRYPRTKKSVTHPAIKNVRKVSMALLNESQGDGHTDMQNGENSKRVTDWPMHYMPQVKDLLRFRQVRNAHGKGCAALRRFYCRLNSCIFVRAKRSQGADLSPSLQFF